MKKLILFMSAVIMSFTAAAEKSFTQKCKDIDGLSYTTITEKQVKTIVEKDGEISVGDDLLNISGVFVNYVIEISVVEAVDENTGKHLLDTALAHYSKAKGFDFIAEGAQDEMSATIYIKKHNNKRYESVIIGKRDKDNKVIVCTIFTKINLFDPSSYTV